MVSSYTLRNHLRDIYKLFEDVLADLKFEVQLSAKDQESSVIQEVK